MGEKKFNNGFGLHEKILKGVNDLANNVATTLGPKGRNVLLQSKTGSPVITKDGVTIAKFISFKEPFANAAAEIVKQAASRTNEEAGDGTTTSTVLARAMFIEAQKYLKSGISPIELKRGMDAAVVEIIQYLKNNSCEVTNKKDIANVATISANGDKLIGELIANAIDLAGKDGAITVEEARSVDTTLNVLEGFIFDSGFVSSQFTTDERRGIVRYEDCLIFVTDHKLESIDEMLPLLELVAREHRPLVIVADSVEGQFLASLIVNVVRGSMKVVAIKAPRYGEERRGILSDLAIATGAKFITRESGTSLKDIKLKDLGKAKTVESNKNTTTIVGGAPDIEKVEERIEILKEMIKNESSIDICERMQERITRLASGIAIIGVGAATQIEMIEKKHRIEDALGAVKAAQLGGIHAGGGAPLIKAAKALKPPDLSEEQKIGFDLVLKATKEPIRQMALNAGQSPDLIVNMVEDGNDNCGYDFAVGKITNLIEDGIIDPVQVTCSALQNAVSVASILITTDYAIVEVQ